MSLPHQSIIMQKIINASILTAIFVVVIFFSNAISVQAQCTGCTSTISTNTAAITISNGQVVCLTYSGTFTQTINFNGGTLCISPATTVSSSISMGSGTTLNVYGKVSGSVTQNGGAITTYNGGTFAPSSFAINGGSLTNNIGGVATISSVNFPSGYVLNNYGAITLTSITLNSGSTVNLSGTSQTINGGVNNNGTFTLTGPATIHGAYSQNSGATTNFSGGINITGSVSNNGTINVSDAVSITGSYSSNSGASVNGSSAGTNCNSFTVGGSLSGSGSFSGNNLYVSPSPSCTSCVSGGAYVAPSSQPSALSLSISGGAVNGSFTAASASISYYLVLRYIGGSAPSDNPVNGSSYVVGNAVGNSRVAAIVTGGSTGTKSFTDNLPAANCDKTAYYRIFSYNGSGSCTIFNTTSPLTGNKDIPDVTAATISASGATTFCSGNNVVLTASSGSSYLWSNGATTQAITDTISGTFTVTVTNALGCTSSASKSVTVNPSPSVSITPANSTVCALSALTLTTFVSGSSSYTYSWTGPNLYTASSANVSIASASLLNGGTYALTVTGANTCTARATASVSVTNCLSVSGAIFDDANGNGIIDGNDTKTTNGQTLYSVLSDTTGKVIATALIASNGTFTMNNIPPNTSGMRIVVNTSNPTIGTATPGYLWPNRWTGTKANYGTDNGAGTGLYANANEVLPVKTGTLNITNITIGYDRLPTSSVYHFNISRPHLNAKEMLVSTNGLDTISGTDPEDGLVVNQFAITSVATMNGNKLYYDADSNGTLANNEQITGYYVINNFVAKRLIVAFTGAGSSSATFAYAAVDAAGKVDPTPSSYMISWATSLPVTLINFDATINESKVSLNWATASELDNDHFELERSADGNIWTAIGEVKGAGTTSEGQKYSYTDLNPLSGVNYYRLKQVDVDGVFTYSNIAEISLGNNTHTANMSVYPNPVNHAGVLNISLSSDNINIVTITNSVGQTVYNNTISEGQHQQISGLDLPAGVYILTVHTQTDLQLTSRLVIQ